MGSCKKYLRKTNKLKMIRNIHVAILVLIIGCSLARPDGRNPKSRTYVNKPDAPAVAGLPAAEKTISSSVISASAPAKVVATSKKVKGAVFNPNINVEKGAKHWE